MKAKFFLSVAPSLTGFQLRREGESWQKEFISIPQALLYARTLPDSEGKIIVMNASGKEVAELAVDPI